MIQPDQISARDEIVAIVPCYNEAKRLDARAFSDFVEKHPNVTIIFVDDGSTDDTPLVLERLRQQHSHQVCTLRLSSNVGKAEAVRRGMSAALRRRPAMIGYWDADLATPLESILRFAEVLAARPSVELVMGSRVALLGREIHRSGVRHVAGRIFATVASVVLGVPVYDTQCGAKLFRVTPMLRELISRPFRSRWIFDVEIVARLLECHRTGDNRHGCNFIYEYPLEKWRDVQNSSLKLLDFAIAAFDLIGIYWQHRRKTTVRPCEAKTTASQNVPLEHPNRHAA